MSNNEKVELCKKEIEELEIQIKYTEDVLMKIELCEKEIALREEYTKLLAKKRPMLLTFALLFCIFYGISLCICLPPYIVRGKKMDINKEKIKSLKQEVAYLKSISSMGYKNS